ncbi:DUF2281 domain-containing protein [[Phormidium] sp. ETS-05]|nr:DUF2281 domain-containing protein [[Phormidium] sp. ETS-05]
MTTPHPDADRLGSRGGQIWMSPDFDEPLEALLQDRM